MRQTTTIGLADAAALLGRSPQFTAHHAKRGALRSVRKSPYRFRVSDVLDFKAVAPERNPAERRGRPRTLRAIIERILTP